MPFKIVRNDITRMNTDAVVNTANPEPVVGSGCDSAIYAAAGYDQLLAWRKEKVGLVPEGEVFLTPGFDLPAKYIIHAVSPLYMEGDDEAEKKLRSCYRKSLQLAKENEIRSIAFPLISTGSYGYPREEGMRIAVDEIHAFLLHDDMDITLVVFTDEAAVLGEKIRPDLEAYIDRNYVSGKLEEEYGPYYGSRLAEPSPEMADQQDDSFLIDWEPVGNRPVLESTRRRNLFSDSDKMAPCPSRSVPMESSSEIDEDYDQFAEILDKRINERVEHLSDTFSQYLMYLIKEKNMTNVEVYTRAIVDRKIFSKIRNNVNYHPQKLTALCLCIGAKLNMDETRDLLARAGYALSPCDKTDIIFSYFIENGLYDMIALDIQLEEHGIPCIID